VISFSQTESIILYLSAIAISIIFAYFAQKFGKNGVHKTFWTISFLFLWVPCAFRASGVDHTAYFTQFSKVQTYGVSFFSSYNGSPEPLFALLEYLIVITVNEFQYLYIITSFITLLFTYMGFSKMYNRTSLSICLLWFSATYYMTFYGLTRMSVAIGIMTYAYHFIEKQRIVKYFIYCTIATLFHYSAAFMFIMYFVLRDKKCQVKSKMSNSERSSISKHSYENNNLSTGQIRPEKNVTTTRKLTIKVISVGLILYAGFKLFPYFFSKFTWYARYDQYFNYNATLSVFNNLAGFYLLFIFLLLWQQKIRFKMVDGNRYITSTWIMVAIGIFSSVFPVTRLAYYLMPIGCYIYGFIPRIVERQSKILFYGIYVVWGIVWWYYVYMMPGHWGDFIIPYQMNLQF
jgi:hypothetical protein